MECFTLPTVSGNLGNGGEDFPIANIQTYNRYSYDSKGDSLLCTFFRRPFCKSSRKANISRSDEDLESVDSSDTCSSSDSEIDNVDDGTLSPRRKNMTDLNPMLDQTSLIGSSRLQKRHKKKRSSDQEAESVSTKHRKLSKKESMHIHRESPIERSNENRISENKKVPLQRNVFTSQRKTVSWKEMENDRMLRAAPSARNISCASERFNCSTRIAPSNEVTSRKRKTMEKRVARNKRLLKSMKEVIYAMNANNRDLSLQGNKVSDNQRGETIKIQRPIFQNDDVEKFLDRSMEVAVKKYKTRVDTWEKLKSENSRAKK